MTPRRIHLQRTKGWRMPPNTVKVDRSTRWGNPFRVGLAVGAEVAIDYLLDAAGAVREFRHWLDDEPTVATIQVRRAPPTREEIRSALRGKNLACWCGPGAPCHADVLLQVAAGEDHRSPSMDCPCTESDAYSCAAMQYRRQLNRYWHPQRCVCPCHGPLLPPKAPPRKP